MPYQTLDSLVLPPQDMMYVDGANKVYSDAATQPIYSSQTQGQARHHNHSPLRIQNVLQGTKVSKVNQLYM